MKINCPGCSALVEACDGPTHKYFGESPGCWKAYGQVLAREYEDKNYWQVHRLTVDTYAAQHPYSQDKRNIQSVNLHLMALYAIIELKLPFDAIPPMLAAAAKHFKNDFVYLTPPNSLGDLTVLDVLNAKSSQEHCDTVWKWAQSVWVGWKPHHAKIEEQFKQTLLRLG
ncbi:MAG: DUF5946 family protein [Proteobacteria bacterium]|nr:DUF5946 family protein [Pseudomonadota bacterium]